MLRSGQDVAQAKATVWAAGGGAVGEVASLRPSDGAQVTWCYVSDPEGNVIELQRWS